MLHHKTGLKFDSLKEVFRIIRAKTDLAPNAAQLFKQLPSVPYRRGDKSLAELTSRFLVDLWARKDFVLNLEEATRDLGKILTIWLFSQAFSYIRHRKAETL
jgi:hypothetical protein